LSEKQLGRDGETRVKPVPPRAWSAAAREAIAILSEQASRIGLEPDDDTHVHNLICTQLHHPDLMKVYFPFLQYLLQEGLLNRRYRELAILRVAWLRQAEYEWTQHVLIGRSAGITDTEIHRLAGDIEPEEWCPVDAWVLQAVDELVETARISDKVWEGLIGEFDTKLVIELIHVVGNYDLIAMFMNSTRLELEDNVSGLRFADFQEKEDA
jgi:alkylhydroperoxidase family enzyme